MNFNIEILTSELFHQHIDVFLELFKLSRLDENKNNPKVIFDIQKSLWTILKLIENSMKKTKKELEEKWENPFENVNFFAHKRLSRIIRTVVDWVVWRNLWYKRAWMVILANNKRNLLNDDFEKLVDEAYYSSDYFLTIISDLTETVRIGDLLFIKEWIYPLIVEAKEWKWENKGILDLHNIITLEKSNKQLSKQLEKLLDTQEILSLWTIERMNARIIDSDFRMFRYFDKVNTAIQKSFIEWYSIEKLNNYMSIRVFYIKTFNSLKLDESKIKFLAKKPKQLIKNWEKDYIRMVSNLDTFYYENNMFLKGISPYSIFPFSDEVCMKLMTWELIIYTYMNIDWLIQLYKDSWWEVEKSFEDLDHIPDTIKKQSWLFWEDIINDSFLTIRKNWYFQTIPVMEIFRMWFEFISFKSYVKFSEELYKNNLKIKNKENKWYVINFIDDKNVFN